MLGVKATQAGHDYGQLGSMQKQVKERLDYMPQMVLADPGCLNYKDIVDVAKTSLVYISSETIKKDKDFLRS